VLFACPATDDFFRSRIDHMIDLRHPLAVLASRMPWQEIEARVAQVFSRKGRAGVAMPDLDLFGEQVQRTVVPSRDTGTACSFSSNGVIRSWSCSTRPWTNLSPASVFDHQVH